MLTVRFRAGWRGRGGGGLVASAARRQRGELAQVQQWRRGRVAALPEHRVVVAARVEPRQVAHTRLLDKTYTHSVSC